MNILYGIIIALIIYPIIGTILFSLVIKLKMPIRLKVLLVTFGHPLFAIFLICLIGSIFDNSIVEYGVIFIAGTLLRIPFSKKMYYVKHIKESDVVVIEYISELCNSHTIEMPISEIKSFTQSNSSNISNKVPELIITTSNYSLTFILLDKNIITELG